MTYVNYSFFSYSLNNCIVRGSREDLQNIEQKQTVYLIKSTEAHYTNKCFSLQPRDCVQYN